MKRGSPPEIPGLVFVQPLGSGGYADVFLYEQQSPRMPVAVKVLKSDGLTDSVRSQFVDEADTMAELGDHPYIVQVFRAGQAEDGRPYLVMKYYPPPNLATRARSERFSVEEVLRTGIQLASAVETAHRANITHRDIKPANVLVSSYGAPGLTDFGIAGRAGQAQEQDSGDVGVSVPWAPPEVLYGQSNGSEQADVYSLAATLWQLLVGRSPFEIPGGDNSAYALMPRIRSTPPPATGRADVPLGLERLLAQAMAKDPTRRPRTALEFARALQAVEQEQRLARTPIVVLDEQGHTTLLGNTPMPGGDDEADQTRVRAPMTVFSPQAPTPTQDPFDGDTHKRGYLTGTRPSNEPARPTYESVPVAGGASARPETRTDPLKHQRTSPLYDPAQEAEDADAAAGVDGRTVKRDPSARPKPSTSPRPGARPGTAASDPDEAAEEVASGGSSRAILIGLAAGVAVLLGVVLYFVFKPSDAPAVVEPPPVVVSRDIDQNPVGVDNISVAPTVTATPSQGAVQFSWSYPGQQAGDLYRLYLAPKAGETVKAVPAQLTVTTHVVKLKPKTTMCATVQVIRKGQLSPMSSPICETAQ